MPGSATELKPASHVPRKEGPVGLQPPSTPDKLPAEKSVPTFPSPPVPLGPAGKQAPSAADPAANGAAEPAAGRTAGRAAGPMPPRVQGSETARSTVLQAVEPLVGKTLPNIAAASRSTVHEAVVQTHQAVSETVTSALGTLGSWTSGLLPTTGEAAQTSSEGAASDPLVPLLPDMPPLGDSSFLPVPGTMQVGSGGGPGLLLLGVLASVLILRRRDGPLSWISFETLKPTSALLLPLERPG
jgi:hypothetical protein